MIVNFGLMSLLILVAHLVRSRVRVLQDYYVPSPMIAGFAALIGGSHGLGFLPFEDSDQGAKALESYPTILVALLFATLLLGARPVRPAWRRTLRQVGDTFFYNLASALGQYGLALLFGLFVLAPCFPGLPQAFPLMLPAAFAGGPGTATAYAAGLVPFGWDEALSVGLTLAMSGLLVGNVGGMVLVNFAARNGWTRLVRSTNALPEIQRRGFVPDDQQLSLGRETSNPMALDALTWHLALALAAVGLAHLLRESVKSAWPGACDVPLFVIAMFAGAALQAALNAAGAGQFVDRRVMTRIGSVAADYVMAFGIAAIHPTVVQAYALPILLMIVFGTVYSIALLWLIGRRAYHNFWFERSLFVFGWNTGVIGTGVALLRVIDPRSRTGTLEDYGLAYAFIAGVDVALMVFLPPLVGSGIILAPAFVLTGAAVLCVALSACLVGWFPSSPIVLRVGEREVIDALGATESESTSLPA
jgi:ESS family glutamate:Na+ symporter